MTKKTKSTPKENIEKYQLKADSSKEKYAYTLKRLHTAGITLTEAKGMSNKELKEALSFKGKLSSLDGLRRVFDQISDNKEVRELVKKETIPYYQKFGYKKTGLAKIEKELNKTVGYTFFDIAQQLQMKFKETEQDSYKHAKALLGIPREAYSELDERELDVLTDSGY